MKYFIAIVAALCGSLAAADNIPKTGLVLWLHAGSVEMKDGAIDQLTDLSG